ncbi:MAG: hypothetical protein V2J19_04040 [Wenzhouxiangella sp.]|nr:hypothetical protein [Wenzhouxiangella sp.]
MSADKDWRDEVRDGGGRDLAVSRELSERLLPFHLDELGRLIDEELQAAEAKDDAVYVAAILRAFSQSLIVLEMSKADVSAEIQVGEMPPVGPESLEFASRILENVGRKQWQSVKRTVDRLEKQLQEIYGETMPQEDLETIQRLQAKAREFSKRRAKGNYAKNSGLLIRAIWPTLKSHDVGQKRASSIIATAFVRQGISEDQDELAESIRQSIHYIEN